ncbi:Cyclin-like F-box [Cordyceps fumosorosea ARSEF 2679]|uniref:Cyclin-like F-box n=1 Tax=Cordyceps fumosorosea (strain ARSEF 2679) TaxID=1081104 RepID=A0A167LB20_CORFA|nr:Cyclin-like F-box [Cordyceps fumosorosea ARSEF 2679]OAA52869.1 Cyclin-like F-box [Cordyceps fumosorosea ARSEF 2679]
MNPLPLSCCGETDATGYLGVTHHCEWSSSVGPDNLDQLTLSQRIPGHWAVPVPFQWRGHDVLHLNADIGSLGALPLEVLHQILHELDIATLARLQRVSQGIKLAVGSLPLLRALLDFGAEIIRGIAATKTGSLMVCRELYAKFRQPFCDNCRHVGMYLYLLTCKRVCFDCLTKTYRYRPLRPMQANYLYSLKLDTVRSFSTFTVPTYTSSTNPARESNIFHQRRLIPNTTSWRLVDHSAVLEHALRAYGSLDVIRIRLQKRMDAPPRRRTLSGRSRARPTMPGVETSLACAVAFPWFDRRSGTSVSASVLCAACMQSGIPLAQCYFTMAHFNEHVKAMGKVIGRAHVRLAS